MTHESRLLLSALSASKEITTQRKTRRTTLTDSSSTSSAASAKSTLFTENPSNSVKGEFSAMKAKKSLALFLVSCICLSLIFCLGIAADDTTSTMQPSPIPGMDLFTFISLCVLAAALIAAIVVCIIKRVKVIEALRAYKSEMKKITWFPWKSVWRSTVFVLICMAAIAVVVGLLDIAIFKVQDLMAGR